MVFSVQLSYAGKECSVLLPRTEWRAPGRAEDPAGHVRKEELGEF